MKIEEGKFYMTRGGSTVGPMVWDARYNLWRSGPPEWKLGDYWHPDGMRMGHVEDDLDLLTLAIG